LKVLGIRPAADRGKKSLRFQGTKSGLSAEKKAAGKRKELGDMAYTLKKRKTTDALEGDNITMKGKNGITRMNLMRKGL